MIATLAQSFRWEALRSRLDGLVPPTSPVGKVLAKLPWVEWVGLILAGAMAFRPATITWNTNPNYSFGWWIPFVAIFLFYERWPTRPAPVAAREGARLAPWLIAGGLIYFAFRLAAEADPDWRPGLWVLGLLYVGSLLAWLRFYGGNGWLRHFVFPVGFLILSVPWFYELERPLTQELMRMNAILVAFSLQVLGVSADALGNIIQLDNCQLGVEEACSGILSLQASLVMGLLLGEIYLLRLVQRAQLVVICLGAALVGNYLRTFFLGIMASLYGSGAVASWHDTAGFSILILTALTGWLVSLLLAEEKPAKPSAPIPDSRRRSLSALHLAVGVFAIAFGTELITQSWFLWKESSMEKHPAWVVKFPKASKEVPLSKVALSALMCDSSAAASWGNPETSQWTAMWFKYNPKPSNRVVMGWHTPDNCLPSAGWVKDSDYEEFVTTTNGVDLKVRPMKFLSADKKAVFVFWIVYPTSGQLPSRMVNDSHAPVSEKFKKHLRDVLKGNRGVGVETLEMAITGLNNYDDAKTSFINELHAMVQIP